MNRRRLGISALAIVTAIGAIAAAAEIAGLHLNFTASAPVGVWRVTPLALADVRRGMLVSICPPGIRVVELMRVRGYLHVGNCPDAETAPLLKAVVAVAGDHVTISSGGIAVNGGPLADTTPVEGMPHYPHGIYMVRPGFVWLASSYSRGSFDSRYFGPVPLVNLRGQATPIIVRGDASGMVRHSFGAHQSSLTGDFKHD